MSHTRGLKRKNAFLQSEGNKTSPAVARIMQEIEAERQKKERLEWYLNEVMKEKELLSRFDDASAVPEAVDAFIAQSSCSTSASSSTSTSTTSSSSTSSFSSSSSVGHTTYVATDYNRWVSDAVTAKVPEPVATAVAASPVGAANADVQVESCARCGCQYVDSQRTCRCRNFESVKKRQRCLSRFVRTGHLLEEDTTASNTSSSSNAITANDVLLSFDLQAFPFVDPSTTTTASSATAIGEDILANVSDEDFLRMILDDAEACAATTNSNSLKAAEPSQGFLGEKSQRRRRASFVGAKDGWDAMLGVGEEGYFATGATASTAVFGY